MSNVFDTLAESVFDTTANLMGYTAEWTPKAGGNTSQAQVHYKAADKNRVINDKRYSTATGIMEAKIVDFPGLKASLDGNTKETITLTIDGNTMEFFAFSCDLIADGKLMHVFMQEKS